MNPSVIIIGTGHKLQAGHDSYTPSQLKDFTDLIDATRTKYRIKLIAEEMSEDVLLPDFGVNATIAKGLADRKKIAHLYVDLTASERMRLNIDRQSLYLTARSAKLSVPQSDVLERTVDELRECLWLVRILTANKWPVLLICGANHGPRIQHLFNAIGKSAILEVNDYEA